LTTKDLRQVNNCQQNRTYSRSSDDVDRCSGIVIRLSLTSIAHLSEQWRHIDFVQVNRCFSQ